MSRTINLTKINGCYSKELRENCYNIKLLVKDRNTSIETMKEFVNKIIEPAFIEAKAKSRFKENLNACQTKDEIDQLCADVVIHGMYYTPKKRKQ
jgi:hypothetical protein